METIKYLVCCFGLFLWNFGTNLRTLSLWIDDKVYGTVDGNKIFLKSEPEDYRGMLFLEEEEEEEYEAFV